MKVFKNRIPSYFFYSFPFVWLLGIDQLYSALFIVFVLLVNVRKFQLSVSHPAISVFLVVSIASLLSVPFVSNWGLWIKFTVSFLLAALYLQLLIGIKDTSKKRETVDRLIGAMFFCSAFISFTLVIFLFFNNSSFTTILSPIFPSNSFFFESMKTHSLGATFSEFEISKQARFSGPFVSYSSMSMAALLLFPISLLYKGKYEKIKPLVLVGLSVGLVKTDSRLAIIAFIIFLTLYFYINNKLFSNAYKNLFKLVFIFSISLFFLMVLVNVNEIYNYINDLFFGARSASASTRLKIYEASISGFIDKPLTGWGHSNPLSMSSQRFSAGTHSSYMALAYQRGIFALLAYVLFVLYLLKISIGNITSNKSNACAILSAGMISFLIRESADIWWWDSLLYFIFLNYTFVYFYFMNKHDSD